MLQEDVMYSRFAVVSLSLVMTAAGCTSAAVASKSAQRVHTEENVRVSGRFVPAGQQLSVRLEQPLDTQDSPRGARFTATVTQPLFDSSGAVLVPAGARLRGHLHSVAGTTGERLRLRFEGIDTVLGFAPISARVDHADYQTYAGAPRVVADYPGWYGGSLGAYPYPMGGGPGYRSWYGGWGYYDYDVYIPREVHLPAGSTMNLTLTRPLLAPGARIAR
jgi:hypothetical protein